MRLLTFAEVLLLHQRVIEQSGGAAGVRTLAGVHTAVMQPHMSFGGEDLYPTLLEKAVALCFSLVMNHPFVDGNKRVGHAALETSLYLNGIELVAEIDAAESVFLNLAAGNCSREELLEWVIKHTQPMTQGGSSAAE